MSDWFIRAEIIRWVDNDPQPGIVECQFIDNSGATHSFIGKYYDFTDQELSSDGDYPQAGFIACEIISRANGEATVETDQITSWRAHESISGLSRFVVQDGQLKQRAV